MEKERKPVKGKRGLGKNMKANLTLSDRFALLGILPVEGSFATLKIVRKLREQLSLTEKEIKTHKVVQIFEQHVTAIKNKKTDAEAIKAATLIYGKDDAEKMAIGIRNETILTNQILWKQGKKTTEMEFGEFAEKLIADNLKKLNETNKLEDKHFTLYEKFVEGQ